MSQILLISNDPVLKQKNIEALTSVGFQITAVSDLLEGLLKIDKNGFDVIIIDEELPDADLYQACQRIRQTSDVPIILLGSEADDKVWTKVEDLGFDFYLRKPLSSKELIVRVKAVLRRAPIEEKPKPEKRLIERPVALTPKETKPEIPQITKRVWQVEEKPKPEKRLIERPVALTPKETKPEISPIPETVQWIMQRLTGEIPKWQIREEPEPEKKLIEKPEVREISPAPEIIQRVLQSAQTTLLLDNLYRGKLTEIKPVIDLTLKDGFTYPEADEILRTSGRETAQILESLAEAEILLKQPFEKLLLTPEGSAQLIPVERCPRCDSSTLVRGRVLEHFACGYVAPEDDFKVGPKYICPKCKRELKSIGTDYRSPGVRYRCFDCKEIFSSPTIKYRCLKTGRSYALDELQEIWLYFYRFDELKKDRVEFELELKAKFIDLLKSCGYEVAELVKATGRSGVTHTLDILATKDDRVVKHTIAIGILVAQPGKAEVTIDELSNFDTKVSDLGIYDKVVIAIPKLSPEGKRFAEGQRIRVFEQQELKVLASGQLPPTPEAEPELPKIDYKAKLIEFLQSHGYEITEKAKVRGRSGVEYTLDICARRDDAFFTQTIAVAISYAKDKPEVGIDEISQFDTKAYDAGIYSKIFVAIPKLSLEAHQFAKQQNIKVLEAKDLESFS